MTVTEAHQPGTLFCPCPRCIEHYCPSCYKGYVMKSTTGKQCHCLNCFSVWSIEPDTPPDAGGDADEH